MLQRFRAFGIALVTSALATSGSTATDEAIREDKVQRINLALRQATLVQRMAQSACFNMGGVQPERTSSAALEDVDTFGTVMDGLQDGHDWFHLLPETNPERLTRLAELSTRWHDYGAAVRQIIHKDFHSVVIAQIISSADATTDETNKLAAEHIGQFGDDVLDKGMADTIVLAGYYRMLSQRALKELCYAHFEIGSRKMPAFLDYTLQEMEETLARLREGGDGILPPPNARIERNYKTAALFWSKMRPVLDKVVNGEAPSEAELSKVIKFNASVLKQLNQAVEGYFSKSG